MLEWIMSIASLCNTALSTGRTLKKWHESRLSARERELLKAAADDGRIQLLENDMDGRFVFAGNREFTSSEDAAIAAKYIDAFIRLCRRGLVMHMGDNMFRLTGQGFDIGRKK